MEQGSLSGSFSGAVLPQMLARVRASLVMRSSTAIPVSCEIAGKFLHKLYRSEADWMGAWTSPLQHRDCPRVCADWLVTPLISKHMCSCDRTHSSVFTTVLRMSERSFHSHVSENTIGHRVFHVDFVI